MDSRRPAARALPHFASLKSLADLPHSFGQSELNYDVAGDSWPSWRCSWCVYQTRIRNKTLEKKPFWDVAGAVKGQECVIINKIKMGSLTKI